MSKPEDDLPPGTPLVAPIEVETPARNKGGRPRKRPLTALPLSERAEAPKVEEPTDASGLLTDAEIKALRAEAKTAVDAERKKAAREKIKAKFIQEERAAHDPVQEMVTVRLALAEYAEGLVIDGVKYFHNGLYTIPRAKYDVFLEQMFRSHEHQNQIDGKSRIDLQRRMWREAQPGASISGKAA